MSFIVENALSTLLLENGRLKHNLVSIRTFVQLLESGLTCSLYHTLWYASISIERYFRAYSTISIISSCQMRQLTPTASSGSRKVVATSPTAAMTSTSDLSSEEFADSEVASPPAAHTERQV